MLYYFYSNYNENDEQDENVDDYSNNDKSKYNIYLSDGIYICFLVEYGIVDSYDELVRFLS